MPSVDAWDRRIERWARWRIAAGRPVLSRLEVGGAAPRGDAVSAALAEALSTDALIRSLSPAHRSALAAWYLDRGTVGERAQRAGVARQTLQRRRESAILALERERQRIERQRARKAASCVSSGRNS